MEVTVASSDAIVWTEVAVPATTGSSAVCGALSDFPSAGIGGVGFRPPPTQVLGTSPYIVWRIHEESPKTLELMELSCDKAVRNTGLRLTFEFQLCPFASVTLSSVRSSHWFIYETVALTVTGVLYTIFLKVARAAQIRFGMSQQSVLQRDLSSELSSLRRVTSFTASSDTLCIGGQSGSVICLHIGTKAELNDHLFELKESEGGLSRLWGGFSLRGKGAVAVKCLAIQQVSGASLLHVLHEDGSLRVWDLVQHTRQFHHVVEHPPEPATSMPKRIWVEDTYVLGEGLKLAILFGGNSSETDKAAAVLVCTLHLVHADGGIRLTQLSLQKTFYVGQGAVLNCRLLQGALWVLQKSTRGQCELLSASLDDDVTLKSCRLQESLVGEQLFQGSSDTCDDLLFSLNQIGLDSSEIHDSVPSLFLRRLLQPGVRQHAALKDALQMRKRRLSDFEIGSLTLDGLCKEIKASINAEPLNCRRYLQEWINFTSNYVESWHHNDAPYWLFADASTGSVGLIRKNSVSVIRSVTRLEKLVHNGSFPKVEQPTVTSLQGEWEEVTGDPLVISGILRCMENITRHLGNVALGVFHEALMRPATYPLQSLVQSFLLILDVGYSSLDSAQKDLEFGVDEIRAKIHSQNQRQRKFSLHMSQSLHNLRALAGSWEAVLDVVCKLTQCLGFPTPTMVPGSNTAAVPLGSVPTKVLSHASSQISWAHFEAARNLLLLLSYFVKVQGQVGLTSSDVSRIQLQILPQVQESLAVSFLLHWLTVSFAEVPPSEDCSLQLSSLQIDGNRGEKVQSERLGAGELALAEILAAAFLETTQVRENFKTDLLPGPEMLQNHVRRFVCWLLIGESSDTYPLTFSGRAITLSSILLQHGQYGNLENFLNAVEHFSTQQHLSEGVASLSGEWSARLHLLGICSLARAQSVLEKNTKDKHVGDAIQCFFRAASGLGESNKVLQSLFFVTGAQEQVPGRAAWRLQYFEWVMQLFDQYNLSEGACQFAHAALEQVDEAIGVSLIENSEGGPDMIGSNIKGRLWANVFKFSLDLELYGNAYCAIISNPDEESKDICLRRFIIVLCDQKASQALCSNELPYGGLFNRVEEELVLKAQNSDLNVKANLYKLLYALHIHHHNVARAAGYMYQYALSIREQGMPKSRAQALSLLQEEVDALAAAVNALQLIEASNGFVSSGIEWLSPTKRRRVSTDCAFKSRALVGRGTPAVGKKTLDCDQLVKEHAFTLARVQLMHAEVKHTSLGSHIQTSDVVVLLLQHGLYEMAFSLVFLFWKESSQKRELEKVFEIMARKCCTLQMQLGSAGPLKFSDDFQLALTLPSDSFPEDDVQPSNMSVAIKQHRKLPLTAAAKSAWEALKASLEKYGNVHPNLKTIVAETILSLDKDMELPLWLIDSFKDVRDSRGMSSTNQVADPAALLRIYLDHGRYIEATYLLLEYFQASTRLRPGDVFKRKQASGVWFPYTLVDRLIRCLSEIRGSSHVAAQNEGLRTSLQNAVLHHFDRIKRDSDDVKVLAEGNANGSWKGVSV